MKKNPGFLARCLIVLTVLALAFQPCTADAATKKKKKNSHHRQALSVTKMPQKDTKSNSKFASIVIDAETGTILSSDSPDALRHPASLTKMMTLLLVFDAVNDGKLSENSRIRISQRAASMPASKLGLKAGSTIRLYDAILSLATLSANDMAVALAETVGNGSESNFARMMTARAQEIGMTRTRFYNASGLPNQYQVTTARDMARLARYMLAHYPQDSRIFSRQRFDYAGRTYMNHNHLMETYAGMDCCKTGFINASGFNLVASAKRDGRRMIGVVFGGRTTASRNQEMASMLDAGFAKARNIDFAALKKAPTTPIAPAKPAAAQPVPAAPAATDLAIAAVSRDAVSVPSTTASSQSLAVENIPVPVTTAESNPSQSLGTLKLADAGGIGDRTEAPVQPADIQPASLTTGVVSTNPGWSIQIGAYQTRLATDQAIERAFKKLPSRLRKNQSTVVPLRTADASWMFRARLTGYTQSEAVEACKLFKDCLTVSPQAY